MADAGVVCQGEANALRDVVQTGPGVLKNLLGSIGAAGSGPAALQGGTSGPSTLRPQQQQAQSSQGSAIPWRRSNVRHTSNELYVDLVESLAVTVAPSGRPLSAFAYGSIAFTSKVSGVPDLLLNLGTGGKGAGMGTKGEQLRRVMERVVFHPCVRLNRWKSEGVLSFVPPDGRFALCGYETDLLGPDAPLTTSKTSSSGLDLPAMIEVNTGLGANGADFEVRLSRPSGSTSSVRSTAAASLQSNLSRPAGFSKNWLERRLEGTGSRRSHSERALACSCPQCPGSSSEQRRSALQSCGRDGGVEGAREGVWTGRCRAAMYSPRSNI